jgi:membrane fusion protein, copper/silver efflux system
MPPTRLRIIVVAAAAVVVATAVAFMMSADQAPRPVSEDTPPGGGQPRAPLSIDGRRQRLIGVRTAHAERRHSAVDLRATGVVAFDETRQVEISAKVDGWVRDLRANYTGISVGRGERLMTLYSPELLATESEYLLAVVALQQHAQTSTLPETRDHALRLTQAARDRLTLWDVGAGEIEALEKRGKALGMMALLAPRAGVIVEKNVIEGMRVTAGQRLFRLADLSTVWVEASVREREIRLVSPGQEATVQLEAYPGETFTGRTAYVYPSVAEDTRTVKVRLQLPNPGGRLRPGMYATVTIPADEGMALVVPVDAIVDDGTQQLVFIAEGDGYFTPRPITIGRRLGEAIEVLTGLREGEAVASGATFFLDSESQLRGALQNYQPRDAASSLEVAFRPRTDPPRAGANTFEVVVTESGRPVTDARVAATLSMPAMPSMNMPAMRSDTTFAHIGGGTYRGDGPIGMAGRWDVTVNVERPGRTRESRQFSLVAR